MSQRLLKPVRVVLALLFFLVTAALFLDLGGRAPARAFDAAIFLQFTPSVVRFAEAASWAAAGFAAVLLLTLFFGRVFCSTVCPLGTLQDIVIRLSGRLRGSTKRVRFRYRRPRRLPGYALSAAAILMALTGSLLLAAHLDPFSHFGRIMGLLVRPLAVAANNLAALTLESLGSYLLAPFDFALAHWQVLLAPLAVTGLLIWMSARHGRLFCNSLCPVGTLLGLVSRIALFRIRIDRASCNLCAKCSLQCKAECIHLKERRVDFDRCVACFDCIPACPESGIGYALHLVPGNKPDPARDGSGRLPGRHSRRERGGATGQSSRDRPGSPSGERRDFLVRGAAGLLGIIGLSALSRARDWPRNERPTEIPVVKEHPVTPPGAGSVARFNAACTACQLCVSVCPTQVLQPSLLAYGPGGLLQPRMVYELAFCTYECTRCAEVCPTDAIRHLAVEAKKLAKIGEVRFIEDNCIVVAEKTACGACAEVCPTQAVHMVPYTAELGIPQLDTAICIGCGACEHSCPTRPHRAIYVEGEPVHRAADAPKTEVLEVEVPEQFPF
jgi:ferredoxin